MSRAGAGLNEDAAQGVVVSVWAGSNKPVWGASRAVVLGSWQEQWASVLCCAHHSQQSTRKGLLLSYVWPTESMSRGAPVSGFWIVLVASRSVHYLGLIWGTLFRPISLTLSTCGWEHWGHCLFRRSCDALQLILPAVRVRIHIVVSCKHRMYSLIAGGRYCLTRR
jgi:hypothetical protein